MKIKMAGIAPAISIIEMKDHFLVPQYSSDTVSFLRPCALRDAKTRRPFAVAILSRNPCLFFLFRFDGWNVLFIIYIILLFNSDASKSDCKIRLFFLNDK